MLVEQKIEQAINEAITSRGFDIVRIKFAAKVLQIMIEKKESTSASIGDCEKVSKIVSMILDVEELISGHYSLEVSSPGIDRPLVKLADYSRFQDKEAKFSLYNEVNDRKKLKGTITKVTNNVIYVKIENDDAEFAIEYENIISASLITKIDFNKK